MNLPFIPESVRVLKTGYSRRMFLNDLMAGVTVGIVALPLAIAFAIASGVNPEQGIYTAVTAGFVISLFSGSRFQIGGPTGAFIIVVYGITARFGYDGLVVATIMAGLLLVLMGLTRLGGAIRFIPYPMTVGFTAGIALIIFTAQIRDFLGLDMTEVPADFTRKCLAFAEHMHTLDPSTLAAILMVVAFHMSEWRFFLKLLRSPRSDVFVLLTTFGLTLFFDLTLAIELGVVLAALLFMNRMANATVIRRTTRQVGKDPHALSDRQVPDGVEVFEIHGPFFFGAANRFKDTIRIVNRKPRVLILRCRHILFIDATALHALEELVEKTHRDKTVLILSGVHAQPLVTLEQSGLYDTIGEENITGNIDDALNRAREAIGVPPLPGPVPFVPTVAREGTPPHHRKNR